MKRSRTTALVLMGAAPLLLVACSKEPEVQTAEGLFTSVEACVDKTQNPYMCKQAFDQARLQAAESAPQFASVDECEGQFGQGQCGTQQTTGGTLQLHQVVTQPGNGLLNCVLPCHCCVWSCSKNALNTAVSPTKIRASKAIDQKKWAGDNPPIWS